MDYPGGGKLIDRFWGSNETHPIERLMLKPGESAVAGSAHVSAASKATLRMVYLLPVSSAQ